MASKAWFQRSAPKSIPKNSRLHPDGIYLDQVRIAPCKERKSPRNRSGLLIGENN